VGAAAIDCKAERIGADYKVYPKRKSSGGTRWISVPAIEVVQYRTGSRPTFSALRALSRKSAKRARRIRRALLSSAMQGNTLARPGLSRSTFMASLSLCRSGRFTGHFAGSATRPALLRDGENLHASYPSCRRSLAKTRLSVEMEPAKGASRHFSAVQRTADRPFAAGLAHEPDVVQSRRGPVRPGNYQNASEYGGVYTRYADDLIFSFSQGSRATCQVVLKHTRRILGEHGFVVNRKKTHILGRALERQSRA